MPYISESELTELYRKREESDVFLARLQAEVDPLWTAMAAQEEVNSELILAAVNLVIAKETHHRNRRATPDTLQSARAAAEAEGATRIKMFVRAIPARTGCGARAYLLDFVNQSGLSYRYHFFPGLGSGELRNVNSGRQISVGTTLDAAYDWAQRNIPIQ